MSSLTIICPNARRVQVKTSPLMLLRQVLEEACLKSGFDINCHQLQTQKRKIVDLSLPFRLSGLPNNSTLEMTTKSIKDDEKKETIVELAIQLASGKREAKKVSPDVPLTEILDSFSTLFGEDLTGEIESTVPCIVYMNKRYTGNYELSSNTLSTLGVTSGKCLMRFERVKLSQDEIIQINLKKEEDIERKKVLNAKFLKLKSENDERERLEKQRREAFEKEAEERKKREEEQRKAWITEETEQPMDTSDLQMPVAGQRDILTNVPQQNPNDWSFDGSAFSRPAHQNTMRLEELNQLLERVDSSLSSTSNPAENRLNAMVEALATGGRISLAEVRARADAVVEQNIDDQEKIEVFANPCDRQAVLFKKLIKNKQKDEPMDISDEFFEIKVEDIKSMQKELRKHVREQTQSAFVSKKVVNRKNRQLKMEAYKHCVIRINIGEHVLQICFNSGEPSERLVEFIKSLIDDETKRNNLKLLFTGQKIVTSNDKNFVDLELAPKSVLIARFSCDIVNAAEIIKNVKEVEFDEAEIISKNWLAVNTRFVPFNATVDESRIQKRPTTTNHTTSPSAPPAKASMPKWMTVGKK